MTNNISLLTEQNLAKGLCLSSWTIRRWRLEHGLPHIRVGNRFFYQSEKVLSWIGKNEEVLNKKEGI